MAWVRGVGSRPHGLEEGDPETLGESTDGSLGQWEENKQSANGEAHGRVPACSLGLLCPVPTGGGEDGRREPPERCCAHLSTSQEKWSLSLAQLEAGRGPLVQEEVPLGVGRVQRLLGTVLRLGQLGSGVSRSPPPPFLAACAGLSFPLTTAH